MNLELVRILNETNTSFYQKVADSFSATRQSPWNGWQRVADHLQTLIPQNANTISVLDLACGNLRFEEFLSERFENETFEFYCYDNCIELRPEEIPYGSHLYSLDISEALACNLLNKELNQPACDLSVAFGFMHHIATKEARLALLESLIDNTKQGGLIAVSFWQFMNHENMAKKARVTTKEALESNSSLKQYFEGAEEINPYAELDENDFFLGWKDTQGIYRYCHHFTQDELDWLTASVSDGAQLIDAFQADGRNDSLNSYLIFKKN